jgi:chloramphenicol 3-O phosphotransferase
MSGFHHTVKLFSDLGFNTIVHEVLEKSDKTLELIELLHEYPILFVHVTCPLEELRRREKERGDRNIGNAEHLLSVLYPQPQDNSYAITVDTFNNSKEECADKIIELIGNPNNFKAFKTLWSQRPK